MAASSSEESLASLCREAEQLKVKIDEEKQKVNDLQRKFHSTMRGHDRCFFYPNKKQFRQRKNCSYVVCKLGHSIFEPHPHLESMIFCTGFYFSIEYPRINDMFIVSYLC